MLYAICNIYIYITLYVYIKVCHTRLQNGMPDFLHQAHAWMHGMLQVTCVIDFHMGDCGLPAVPSTSAPVLTASQLLFTLIYNPNTFSTQFLRRPVPTFFCPGQIYMTEECPTNSLLNLLIPFSSFTSHILQQP